MTPRSHARWLGLTLTVFGLVCLGALASADARDDEPVHVTWKWPDGEQRAFRDIVDHRITATAKGKTNEQHRREDYTGLWQILEIGEDGGAKCRMQYDTAKIELASGPRRASWSSESSNAVDELQPTLHGYVRLLQEWNEFIVNPRDKTVSAMTVHRNEKGVERFPVPAPRSEAERNTPKDIAHKTGVVEGSFLLFHDRRVKVGDELEAEAPLTVLPGVRLLQKRKLAFEEVIPYRGSDCAFFRVTAEYEVPAGVDAKLVSAEATGRVIFDIEQGFIRTQSLEETLVVEMSTKLGPTSVKVERTTEYRARQGTRPPR